MNNIENIAWKNFETTINNAYEKIVDNYNITDYLKESQQEKINFLYSENVNVFNYDKIGLPSGRSYDFLMLILKKNNLTKITKQEYANLVLNNAKEIYTKYFKDNFEKLALIEEKLKNKANLTKETAKQLYKERKAISQKIYPVCGIIEEETTK